MTRFLLCWMALTATALAQDGPRGLTDAARKEIIRRGAVVQIVSDDIADEGTERICSALGTTPPLDNDKFNLTILYGKFKNAQLDAVKDDLLAPSDKLGAWVNCKNRKQGTYDVYSTDESHLHVRFEQVPNPAQPDKWKGHDKFPTMVLQTPYSGRFGKPGLVIDFKVGYELGKPDQLSDWIGHVLEKFLMTTAAAPTKEFLALKNKVTGHTGHRLTYITAEGIGAAAPFDVTPKMLPVGDTVPSPFPPNFAPTDPKPLDLAAIQAAIAPENAPADFLLKMLSDKVTTADQVKMAWMLKKLADKPADPTPAPTPSWNPFEGRPFLTWLFVGGGGLLILQVVLKMFGINIPLPPFTSTPTPSPAPVPVTPSATQLDIEALGKQMVAEFMRRLPIKGGPAPSSAASPASGAPPSQ